MSKGTFTQAELEQAQNDYWFKDEYITLESGNKVSKAELEQAQREFWDQPQTTKLELSVSQEIRQFLMAKLGISPNDQIVITWGNGNSKITLSADNSATMTKLESDFTLPADGHYTQAEFNQAVSNFWD